MILPRTSDFHNRLRDIKTFSLDIDSSHIFGENPLIAK